MFYEDTKDFMTKIAPFYDYICFPCSDERILFFEKFKDKNSVKSVLDMACSTGETCCRLHNNGFEVSGLDFSSGMINRAQKKAQDKKIEANFYLSDMSNLQIIGKKFDIVYNNSLIWIPTITYIREIISAVSGILNSDGIFIIDIPNSDLFISTYKPLYISTSQVDNKHLYKITTYKKDTDRINNKELSSLQTYINQDIESGIEEIYSCWLKLRLHSLDELRNILEEYGFQIMKVYGDYMEKDTITAGSYQIISRKQ